MGSAQSSEQRAEDEDSNEEDEGEEDDRDLEEEEEEEEEGDREPLNPSKTKVLRQEPEILTCHASASPLSPQLSTVGTPRLLGHGPSIKVWDPCNVLGPPPPPATFPIRGPLDALGEGADRLTEVFLVSHGECEVGQRPDLVAGRWPAARLTGNGERQARALAVFLNSQGVRFNAVYTSPLDRARETAVFVCGELGFQQEQIQSCDALTEMSNGQWEGCHRSEIYTPDLLSLIDRTQPDFIAPSGESLRQVEYRMMEFLNRTVIKMPDKLSTTYMLIHQNESKGFSRQSSTNSVPDQNGPLSQWDLLHRHNRQGLTKKKSGKSRLQFVATGDNDTEDDFSSIDDNHLHEANTKLPDVSVGIFTHATPIKCLLTGLLECSPAMAARFQVEDSSITIIQHSLRTGWQIKRLNDTAHLRLM